MSIFLVRMVERKREAELREQGLWFEDEPDTENDPMFKEFDEDDDEPEDDEDRSK